MSFCTFTLGALLFGIPVERVLEVLRAPATTPVPRAPRAVSGLVNVRGQILVALDLARRLGVAERPAGAAAMLVLVSVEGGALALVVDEIGDVVCPSGEREPPPRTLPPRTRELILGVHVVDGQLLLALDVDRVASGERERV